MDSKNIIIKRIICIFAVIAIVTVSLSYIGSLLQGRNKGATCKLEYYDNAAQYDILMFGTSHMYNMVLPMELWDKYGITSFNWGYSNCTLAMDYYVMKNAIEHGNPKLCIVDIAGLTEYENEGNGKYKNSERGLARELFASIPFSITKLRAVYDIFDDYDDRLDMLAPILYYHGRWDSVTSEDLVRVDYYEKGAQYIPSLHKWGIRYEVPPHEDVVIDSKCFQYIFPMIELCRKNGVEILFVYNPSATSEEGINNAYTMETVFVSLGVPYLNMISADFITDYMDFAEDGGHLNYSGAMKLTDYIGAYVVDNYPSIIDHRQEEEYSDWYEYYDNYVEYKKSVIQNETDFFTLLMLTYGDDFEKTVYIDSSCGVYEEQAYMWPFIHNGDPQCEPIKIDGLELGGVSYPIVLEIRDSKTGEIILKRGFEIDESFDTD